MSVADRIGHLSCPTEKPLYNCMRYQERRHFCPTIASLHIDARVRLGFRNEVALMTVFVRLLATFRRHNLKEIWQMPFICIVSVIVAYAVQGASTFGAISKRIRKRNGCC